MFIKFNIFTYSIVLIDTSIFILEQIYAFWLLFDVVFRNQGNMCILQQKKSEMEGKRWIDEMEGCSWQNKEWFRA